MKRILTVYSQHIATLHTKARVLNGLILYFSGILLSTDIHGYLILWCLRTYTCICRVRIQDHFFLTHSIISDTFFSGGKKAVVPKTSVG